MHTGGGWHPFLVPGGRLDDSAWTLRPARSSVPEHRLGAGIGPWIT